MGFCKEQDLLLKVVRMVLGDGVKKQNYMAPSFHHVEPHI